MKHARAWWYEVSPAMQQRYRPGDVIGFTGIGGDMKTPTLVKHVVTATAKEGCAALLRSYTWTWRLWGWLCRYTWTSPFVVRLRAIERERGAQAPRFYRLVYDDWVADIQVYAPLWAAWAWRIQRAAWGRVRKSVFRTMGRYGAWWEPGERVSLRTAHWQPRTLRKMLVTTWQGRALRRLHIGILRRWHAAVHPGRHSVNWHDYLWRVFLDGAELKRCVTFDTREGWADVFKTDREGKLVIEGDTIPIVRVHGQVTAERLSA